MMGRMRRRKSAGVALACGLAGFFGAALGPAPGTARAEASGEFLLADSGRALATIVIADEPDIVGSTREGAWQTVRDWALFLQQELKRATGAEFPLVSASGAPESGLLILVGDSPPARAAGFDGAAGLAPEEARIATFARGVAVYGERVPANERGAVPVPAWAPMELFPGGTMADRGTPHAVVFFLEKFVGYRYYAVLPGDLGTVVPSAARLALPVPADFRAAPDFPYRESHVRNRPDWLVPCRQVFYREGASVDLTMNHVYHATPEQYPDRPEIFARHEDGSVQAGRRQGTPYCYAADEYFELFMEHVEHFDRHGRLPFRQQKGGRVIASPFSVNVGPHDANWDDWDPRSQEWIDRERSGTGSHSDLLGQFLARLGAAVGERWPGRRVKFLAQNRYSDAPGERVKLPENVDVLWCLRRPASMTNQPAYRDYADQAMKDWHEALGGERNRLAIWEYIHRPQVWTKIPVWAPHSTQRFLREHRDRFAGMFFNHHRQGPIAFPYLAVAAELRWDADLDVEAYFDEFCALMFGPAGDDMRALFALVIDRYENTVWTEGLGHPVISDRAAYRHIFPPETVSRIAALLEQAREKAAAGGEPIHLERIDYMINPGGDWGFDAFFRASAAFHRPARAVTLEIPPVADDQVRLDGKIDEPAWEGAAVARLLEGDEPETLHPVRRWWETDVRLLAGDEGLYVAFTAVGEVPSRAEARPGDSEALLRDDHLVLLVRGRESGRVSLPDAELHDLTDAEAVRALAGINGDLYVAVNPAGLAEPAGVRAAASIQAHAYTVEMLVPWRLVPGADGEAPAELAVDFRRFTAPRRGVEGAEIPMPRWQSLSTDPGRWTPAVGAGK